MTACTTAATTLHRRNVVTVEGLERDGRLHPVQEAFLRHRALQCGYCTPGILIAAVSAIERHRRELDESTVREAISQNVCRCTGYASIVAAILDAAVPRGPRGGEEQLWRLFLRTQWSRVGPTCLSEVVAESGGNLAGARKIELLEEASIVALQAIRCHSESRELTVSTCRGSVSRYGKGSAAWVWTVTVSTRSDPSNTRHNAT